MSDQGSVRGLRPEGHVLQHSTRSPTSSILLPPNYTRTIPSAPSALRILTRVLVVGTRKEARRTPSSPSPIRSPQTSATDDGSRRVAGVLRQNCMRA